jgi:hypothetical protein
MIRGHKTYKDLIKEVPLESKLRVKETEKNQAELYLVLYI